MYKLLTALLVCFYTLAVSGQVKIGATTPPHPFSALELENVGKGVRMPQLTDSEKNNLTTKILANSNDKKLLAGGLVIYNTTQGYMEMWQESSELWIPFPYNLQCTSPTSVTINPLSATTITEYTNDLDLEAVVTGASANAGLYYEWYKDGVQIGRGKTFSVPAASLAFTYTGQYTVKVISCYNQNQTEAVTSAPTTITINE